MGLTKPIEQYLFSNLLTKIHIVVYLKDIIRGDKVTDNGITMTMSEAYCDGVYLYVSFVIERDTAFDTWTTDEYIKSQLNYDGTMYIESSEGRKPLNDSGLTGLEGKFTDAFTFVGVKSFSLSGLFFRISLCLI